MSDGKRQAADCLVCARPLEYFPADRRLDCAYCGRNLPANSACAAGHFVCDECHAAGGLEAIEKYCLATKETDLIAMLDQLRRHPAIPRHGPEHHAIVPGVILAAARNRGLPVTDEMIASGVQRGGRVPGGVCGLSGNCGAAPGVGTAFALLLGSSPLDPKLRQTVLRVTSEVLAAIAANEAARCCQRECWIALKKAAELSARLLPVKLEAATPLDCGQRELNRECFGVDCPVA